MDIFWACNSFDLLSMDNRTGEHSIRPRSRCRGIPRARPATGKLMTWLRIPPLQAFPLLALAVTICFGGCLGRSEISAGSRAVDSGGKSAKEGVPAFPVGSPSEPHALPIRLENMLPESLGITFVHTDGSAGHYYIVETVTGGVAVFDYDGDLLPDIYFLNGAPLPGWSGREIPTNALYRNMGHWYFVDVTLLTGTGDPGYGLGVAAADYNNDGFIDLYVNNFGPNRLYRNNGDGTFTDVTQQAGVSAGNLLGAGAAFLDVDNDGQLDLYVANYVNFNFQNHVFHRREGYPEYAGPRDYQPVPDILYRNQGDGTFLDVSQSAGIAPHPGTGMGLVACDYDEDGDMDIFVLNDVAQNFLFRNDGKGYFEEVAILSGTAFNVYGDELGSMGVDCGDFDGDGDLDFYMTSYQGEFPVLYRNLGNGLFEDATALSGAGAGAYPYVNWGTGLIDLDNDGDLDLYIANGHLQDQIELYNQTTAYRVEDIVLANDGKGNFQRVSPGCFIGPRAVHSSWGCAFDDFDGDGKLEVVVSNSREAPTIWRNRTPGKLAWIRLILVGTQSNRSAVGAWVVVETRLRRQVAQLVSGRGYQSHWGLTLHFGLGEAKKVEKLEIRWPSGTITQLKDLPVCREIVIIEGELPLWFALPR